MKWTTEKPTKPGWYWMGDPRFPGDHSIIRIDDWVKGLAWVDPLEEGDTDEFIQWLQVMPDTLLWAGPIPEPEVQP